MISTESLTTIFIKYEFWYPVKYPPNTCKTGAKHQSEEEEVRYYDDSLTFFSGNKMMDSLVNLFHRTLQTERTANCPTKFGPETCPSKCVQLKWKFPLQRREFTLSILFLKKIWFYFFYYSQILSTTTETTTNPHLSFPERKHYMQNLGVQFVQLLCCT